MHNTDDTESYYCLYPANSEEIMSRLGDLPHERLLITSCTSLAEIIISFVNYTVSEDLNSSHNIGQLLLFTELK